MGGEGGRGEGHAIETCPPLIRPSSNTIMSTTDDRFLTAAASPSVEVDRQREERGRFHKGDGDRLPSSRFLPAEESINRGLIRKLFNSVNRADGVSREPRERANGRRNFALTGI